MKVFEGGPPNIRFSLTLIAVDRETHQLVLRWFDEARTTGSYPGMPLGAKAKVLSEVELFKLP